MPTVQGKKYPYTSQGYKKAVKTAIARNGHGMLRKSGGMQYSSMDQNAAPYRPQPRARIAPARYSVQGPMLSY